MMPAAPPAELQRQRDAWQAKALLRAVYSRFYTRIAGLVDRLSPGAIVEIGSGIGNLKCHLPQAFCTDLLPNPSLDLLCDGYELPFLNRTISHLVLFDVFHHLAAPCAFLKEARRVLHPAGRLILFDPYISWASYPVYGLLHPEPVGWRRPINRAELLPGPRPYYAAQGNATRLFFSGADGLPGWELFHREAFASFSYLLSGGYRGPTCYPLPMLPLLERLDQWLTHWPRLFAARCLVGLRPR